jgi:hypothetical protein
MSDSEFLVFEKALSSYSGMDSYMVKLVCDRESLLPVFTPINMTISEGFSYASPIITITFNDAMGALFNTFKIDPEAVYTLYFGRNMEDVKETKMKTTKIMLMNESPGKSENISFKIFFTWHGWYEMYAKHHNRGWKERFVSDIVAQLASEGMYEEVDIYPTNQIFEHIVQPHWTNAIFLNWLRERSCSVDATYGHYEFGCTIDGKFFYKPLSAIIEQQRENAIREDLTSFILMGQPETHKERDEQIDDNKGIRAYFTNFTVREHYMNSVLNGAGGVRSFWFDSETGNLVPETHTYSQINGIQLTHHGALKRIHEQSDYPLMGGRSSCTTTMAKHKISNVANSVISFDIISEGTPQSSIGKLVETIIPSVSGITIDPFNLTYSGFYLIGAVNHELNLLESKMRTTHTLVRQGYDNQALKGYTSSSSGRFI